MSLCGTLRILFITLPILLVNGLRLGLYVILLLPGFIRFGWYYWAVAHRKSIRFGSESCRQTLDLYYPTAPLNNGDDTVNSTASETLIKRPVLMFFPGGAWLIGYKMWGALLARILTATGMFVVIPDYRNYPWGTVSDQVNDVEAAIAWTLENIEQHGGDANKLVVSGQSAGGHLVGAYLIWSAIEQRNQATQLHDEVLQSELQGNLQRRNSVHISSLKGFLSLSAPFRLSVMQRTFRRHGFDDHLIDRIFGGDTKPYDPFYMLQTMTSNNESECELQVALPPFRIYHGTMDKTVPCEGAKAFYDELEKTATDTSFHTYEGWTHTDAILEGPMDADHRFHRDIFDSVLEWTGDDNIKWLDADSPILRRLCFSFLIKIARHVTPF